MRAKLEKMLEICDLIDTCKARKFALTIRLMSSECKYQKDKEPIEHRWNLISIYIEFLNEKLNRLKLEL